MKWQFQSYIDKIKWHTTNYTSTSAQSKNGSVRERHSTKLRSDVITQWTMTNHMLFRLHYTTGAQSIIPTNLLCVALTFDLLTPKVDRFTPLPADRLYQYASQWVHLFSKYSVDKFGNRRTDGRTYERTTRKYRLNASACHSVWWEHKNLLEFWSHNHITSGPWKLWLLNGHQCPLRLR